MCEFCHKHGEGKKWYLQAQNYSEDLLSDLRRRNFIADFFAHPEELSQTMTKLERLDRAPAAAGVDPWLAFIVVQDRHRHGASPRGEHVEVCVAELHLDRSPLDGVEPADDTDRIFDSPLGSVVASNNSVRLALHPLVDVLAGRREPVGFVIFDDEGRRVTGVERHSVEYPG